MKRTLTIVALVAISSAAQVQGMAWWWGGSSKKDDTNTKEDANRESYDIETNRDLYRAYREMKGEKFDRPTNQTNINAFTKRNVPWIRREQRNINVTEIARIGDRDHSPVYYSPYPDFKPSIDFTFERASGKRVGLNDAAVQKLKDEYKAIYDALAAGAIDIGQAEVRQEDAKYDAAVASDPSRERELRDMQQVKHLELEADQKKVNIWEAQGNIARLDDLLRNARGNCAYAKERGDTAYVQELTTEIDELEKIKAGYAALKTKAEAEAKIADQQQRGLLSKFKESSTSSGLAGVAK